MHNLCSKSIFYIQKNFPATCITIVREYTEVKDMNETIIDLRTKTKLNYSEDVIEGIEGIL